MNEEELKRQACIIFDNYKLTPIDLVRFCELFSRSSMNSLCECPSERLIRALGVKIEDIDFSNRVMKRLKSENYKTVADIVSKRKVDFNHIYGFGKDSVNEIEEYLSENCLSFEMYKAVFWYEKNTQSHS